MDKKIPEIRFKEFDGEWENHSLGEMFAERNERSADGELISVTIGQGIVKFSETGRVDSSSQDKSHYKKVYIGDIAYNSMRMWQGACGYSNYEGIVSPAYTVVYPIKESDVTYFYYSFKREDTLYQFRINSQGLTSDTWNLKYQNFSKIELSIPTVGEQKRIAKLFTTIDKLIDKLERKLEKLRNIKQALLNQMFINVNRGGYEAPLLRFVGYNEPWVMKQLSEITERITRKNSNNVSSLPLTISAQYGLIDQREFFNSRIASKDVSGYYLIKKGEFAYNKSSSEDYPYGVVKRLDKYKEGVLSTLYIVIAHKKDVINSDFLVSYYDTPIWYDDISKKAAEGARNHGLLNISTEDFFSTQLLIPSNISEQRLIGTFFKKLDDMLLSNSNKLIKLRHAKQSLLRKMFV